MKPVRCTSSSLLKTNLKLLLVTLRGSRPPGELPEASHSVWPVATSTTRRKS